MEDIIANLINAKGSDRAKVHELLQEYLTSNRDESEFSSDNDDCTTDVGNNNDNEDSTNFDDEDDFETNSDSEDIMRHAKISGEVITNEDTIEYQKAAAFRYYFF